MNIHMRLPKKKKSFQDQFKHLQCLEAFEVATSNDVRLVALRVQLALSARLIKE